MNEFTLLNDDFEKILSILMQKVKSKRRLIKNRNKILEYLRKTNDVDENTIKQPAMFIEKIMNEPKAFDVDSFEKLHLRTGQFCEWLLHQNKNVDKKAFSLPVCYTYLICYYFYMSERLI